MDGTTRRRSSAALLVGVDAVVLIALRGTPARTVALLGQLGRASDSADADRAAAALCSTGLFLVAAWLGLGITATAAAALPGVGGRIGRRASRLLLPALIRRVLAGTAGLGVLLAPVAAYAATSAAQPVTHYNSASAGAIPTPTWPTAARRAAPPATRPHAIPATGVAEAHTQVRVVAGDSLWLIAAHRLGGDATDADIGRYWPRVYARNRSVIGSDPDLIKPGQRLTLPDPTAEELPS
jgi:nucleoid-associated protein YgaU